MAMSLGPVWSADIALAAASVLLTAWIFVLYLKRAAEIRSRFSYGLAALSAIFFAESLATIGIYYSFSARYTADVAMPLLALSALSLAGFVVLLWIAKQ